jgi:hypothetical protein
MEDPSRAGPSPYELRPLVEKARPRVRPGWLLALLMTVAAGVIALLARGPRPARHHIGTAGEFSHCTPLEVELTVREMTAASSKVVCLAVAGQTERARQLLEQMEIEERNAAIQRVFAVAHPIADAGDDRSAGPIMTLVVEYWPNNFMAVFHAGMAEFALGHDDAARVQLTRFLEMYGTDDVWRGRARKALGDLAAGTPLGQREAHFRE